MSENLSTKKSGRDIYVVKEQHEYPNNKKASNKSISKQKTFRTANHSPAQFTPHLRELSSVACALALNLSIGKMPDGTVKCNVSAKAIGPGKEGRKKERKKE
jgi:hypothetical protein